MSRRHGVPLVEPICVECGKLAREVTGAAIYPRRPDLHAGTYWLCECGAYCGSHPGTDAPLGYPCNAATRRLRSDAHRVFDELWAVKIRVQKVPKHEARGKAYAWLSEQLGLPPADTHIAMMNADQARKVIDLCAPIMRRITAAKPAEGPPR